jgi:hypothetical protein
MMIHQRTVVYLKLRHVRRTIHDARLAMSVRRFKNVLDSLNRFDRYFMTRKPFHVLPARGAAKDFL